MNLRTNGIIVEMASIIGIINPKPCQKKKRFRPEERSVVPDSMSEYTYTPMNPADFIGYDSGDLMTFYELDLSFLTTRPIESLISSGIKNAKTMSPEKFTKEFLALGDNPEDIITLKRHNSPILSEVIPIITPYDKTLAEFTAELHECQFRYIGSRLYNKYLIKIHHGFVDDEAILVIELVKKLFRVSSDNKITCKTGDCYITFSLTGFDASDTTGILSQVEFECLTGVINEYRRITHEWRCYSHFIFL